jgi:hypothetical protein
MAAVVVCDDLLIERFAPEVRHRRGSAFAGGHVDAQILEGNVGHDATISADCRAEYR